MINFNDAMFFESTHSIHEWISHELEQFKIHQHLPLITYKQEREVFLKKIKQASMSMEFIQNFEPRIGVFAGSFNPFHKGHYNVLCKAEKIFDKVIIAFGQNPEKKVRHWEIPKTITNRQIETYTGLLTDFVQTLQHDVVIIRGLRNSTDFQYEQNQYRYIQELMPGINIINIFCDKEFEHISSSGIRTLEKFNKHQHYLLD